MAAFISTCLNNNGKPNIHREKWPYDPDYPKLSQTQQKKDLHKDTILIIDYDFTCNADTYTDSTKIVWVIKSSISAW